MGARRFAWAVLAAALTGALLGAPSAQASFHLNMVREVYPGSAAEPTAEYVELQAYAPGQNFVSGISVTFYGAGGTTTGTATFPSDVAHGENQDTILIATAAAASHFSVTPDLTIASADMLSPNGGAVCWYTVDCVSWGNFSGSLPSSAGTPAPVIPDGMALRRTIARGCATALDEPDDTNSSNADFAAATPEPRNNSMPPDGTLCTTRSTSTSLGCTPSTLVVSEATACTATVTDTAAGTASAPSGSVAFSSNTSGGSFSPAGTCTLSPSGYSTSQSSCQVSYTPSQVGSGTQRITGAYGGDSAHATSSGSAMLTVTSGTRSTSTGLSCTPSTLVVSEATACTATVTDTAAGTASAPSGKVSFSSDTSGGRYSPATSCTLSPVASSASQSSCQVSYTPGQVGSGTQRITGAYGGDSTHAASQGSASLGVSAATSGPEAAPVSPPPSPLLPSPPPSDSFGFGGFQVNKRLGFGSLTVDLPGPGAVTLSAAGIAPVSKQVAGGVVKLKIVPEGRKRKLLARRGKLTVKVKVTFTPTGGVPGTRVEAVRLVKLR